MLSSRSNFFLCSNSKYYALTSQSRQHCLESGLFLASLSFTGICFSNICFSDVWELLVHLSAGVFLSLSSDEESFHKHCVFFLFRAISREAEFVGVVLWAKNTGARGFGGVSIEKAVIQAGTPQRAVRAVVPCFMSGSKDGCEHLGIQPADVTKLKRASGTLEDERQIQSDF